MKLYLAGPMRGIPKFNFPAFDKAAAGLRAQGHYVFSPAERDRDLHDDFAENNLDGCGAKAALEHGFSLRDALGDDTAWICKEAEGIALLKGWHDSKGARAEFALAMALGLQVIYLEGSEAQESVWVEQSQKQSDNEPFTPQAIERTKALVTGQRHDAGKLRVDLIPPEWIEALAEVLTAGAKKYADRNWELGMKWSKVRGPLGRHLLKWDKGGVYDRETGCPHLAMVAWNALALLTYELRGIGENDIPVPSCAAIKVDPVLRSGVQSLVSSQR